MPSSELVPHSGGWGEPVIQPLERGQRLFLRRVGLQIVLTDFPVVGAQGPKLRHCLGSSTSRRPSPKG